MSSKRVGPPEIVERRQSRAKVSSDRLELVVVARQGARPAVPQRVGGLRRPLGIDEVTTAAA